MSLFTRHNIKLSDSLTCGVCLTHGKDWRQYAQLPSVEVRVDESGRGGEADERGSATSTAGKPKCSGRRVTTENNSASLPRSN